MEVRAGDGEQARWWRSGQVVEIRAYGEGQDRWWRGWTGGGGAGQVVEGQGWAGV